MSNLLTYLKGGDLRSIANADEVISLIKKQSDFDKLFEHLFDNDRLIRMRAADAIEKITLNNTEYLKRHKQDIIKLMNAVNDKELKWHLALMVSRLDLKNTELGIVWDKLTHWATNNKESKIVRVNSIQSLFNLVIKHNELKRDFDLTIQAIKSENIPSINARLRKLKIMPM
ncbi:MAG: hypothetical protein CR986_04220 [Ignavibacteriae bacterium]|nr:MAG: hypothetical protein CR986_04220 [Ignavibacteriota bacterium]